MLPEIRRNNSENGQTLILSVLAMLVLLMATILLFDIHNIIRLKMKSQTAVDSAAIAAANWQKTSLNLIGELNIVKACTVLISDIQPKYAYPSDYLQVNNLANPDLNKLNNEIKDLIRKSDLVTEMQARILFVGPLIGFGAAQQAAKNNGSNYNERYCGEGYIKTHIDSLKDDNGNYSDSSLNQYAPEGITKEQVDNNGRRAYCWRQPYIKMLEDIASNSISIVGNDINSGYKGIAVWPSEQRADVPTLESDKPEFIVEFEGLQDPLIYGAINSNDWCYIRHLIRMSYGEKWWGNITFMPVEEQRNRFSYESEYMPIFLDFTTGANAAANSLNGYPQMIQDRNYKLLSADYDSKNTYLADSNGNIILDADGKPIREPSDNITDRKMNPLSFITWATYGSYWQSLGDLSDTWDIYLNKKIKKEYRYSGGAVRMSSSFTNTPLSGNWRKLSEMSEKKNRADLEGKYLGNKTSEGGVGTGGTYGMGQKINTYAQRLKNSETNYTRFIHNSSMAKAFGRIPMQDGTFDVPIATRMTLPVFERAALIPRELESPPQSTPPDPDWLDFVTKYLPTLGTVSKLEDMPAAMLAAYPEVWNSGRLLKFHNALLKLDNAEWRQQGIDWLEYNRGHKPIYGDIFNPTLITGYTPDDFNEDHCDDWFGTGPGHREGPALLF